MLKLNNFPSFSVQLVSDTLILIIDEDSGPSITNRPEKVIADLDARIDGGIGKRSVFYRDTTHRYDQLVVRNGVFAGFAPCTAAQQQFLNQIIDKETN